MHLGKMKKVNKQCLLDTPRTVRVSEKTWQVIVRTREQGKVRVASCELQVASCKLQVASCELQTVGFKI